MKSLVESIFDDNITTEIPIDFDSVVDYVRSKIDDANKDGINIEIDQNTRGNYIVSFYSPLVKNAKNLYEQININFVIVKVNLPRNVVIIPYVVYGVDESFNLYLSDSKRVLGRIKGITFNSVWGRTPNKLIKTIDGFFEGFEKIHKDKQPIITDPKQMTINGIGLALFYNKMKKYFKYPNLKKID